MGTLWVVPIRASETLARVKIPGAAGRERLAFLAWGDVHAR